jgi:hypothetical protein
MTKYIFYFCIGIIIGLGLVSICLQLLWNWLMPVIFHLPIITFWQSLGLLALQALLFPPKIRTKFKNHD